jgi:hypothetical protein
MIRKLVTLLCGVIAPVCWSGVAWQMQALAAPVQYPNMASIEQYMMDRNAEIALAQNAAPPSISRDAEIWVLGAKGYEAAVKGTNGFACIVQRSWAMVFDDPEFWNPKIRGAMCFNPPAAQSVLPPYLARTRMVLAGQSKAQIMDSMKAAFDKNEWSAPAPGSMCYMLPGSPVLVAQDPFNHMTIFLLPVSTWSDGTAAPPYRGE